MKRTKINIKFCIKDFTMKVEKNILWHCLKGTDSSYVYLFYSFFV